MKNLLNIFNTDPKDHEDSIGIDLTIPLLLTVIFAICKLLGIISIGWMLVMAPIWIVIIIAVVWNFIFSITKYFKK